MALFFRSAMSTSGFPFPVLSAPKNSFFYSWTWWTWSPMSPISFSRTFLAQFDLVQCLFSPIRCDGTKISFRKLTILPAFMFLIRDITPPKWICLLTGPPWWQRSHELVLSRIGFEEGTLVRLGSLARDTWWDIFKKRTIKKKLWYQHINLCS